MPLAAWGDVSGLYLLFVLIFYYYFFRFLWRLWQKAPEPLKNVAKQQGMAWLSKLFPRGR